jgi:hypothetical protein
MKENYHEGLYSSLKLNCFSIRAIDINASSLPGLKLESKRTRVTEREHNWFFVSKGGQECRINLISNMSVTIF